MSRVATLSWWLCLFSAWTAMCAKHDSLVYVTRVMWHDSHVCVPYHKHVLGVMCLMYVCNMQHTCDMTCLTCDACNVLGRRAKGVAVTPLLWLTWPMLMSNTTHSHAWHDSERGARVSVYLCLRDCVSWHEGGEVTHCNTLQHTATHCNALQHTATHCNTLCDRVHWHEGGGEVPQALI